jgi:pyruvate,orthophosphate dikinase
MKKYIYYFDEGNKDMRSLLGGKGANLAEMTRMGLPIPHGFTITTETSIDYINNGKQLPEGLWEQILEYLKLLEEKTGKGFGKKDNPLLVSVRSGAAVSMPGMMDTILNLGLNKETIEGLIKKTGDERFTYDSYRRFIQMFGNVVMGIEGELFENILEDAKNMENVKNDADISVLGLKEIIRRYKELVLKETNSNFPDNPEAQLKMSVEAVFNSWNNRRAIAYRKIHKISDDLGTAVNIQEMVFGNMGNDSGTGVGFTRNPSTGLKENYGEYLLNAQGEDVVAGVRTPKPLEELKNDMPEVYNELIKKVKILETNYKDLQDYEFTIEKGKLYILQTRNGKRTAQAAFKIAVDLVREGIIDKETAVMRIDPNQLNQLLHRRVDPSIKIEPIATGLPASPGATSGKIVFSADEAEERGKKGEEIILIRTETTPDDIHGLVQAKGTLTSRGGMTSHAAVVARGMGKPCVTGCNSISINSKQEYFKINNKTFKAGDYITIDGGTGNVYEGKIPLIEPEMSEEFEQMLLWADSIRKLGIYANADTPEDVHKARDLGAEGIGLCRTEHMFMAPERLPIVQDMIIADSKEARKIALDKLLPMQQSDFAEILKAMDGLSVIIRLLDPPLHEFLPNYEDTLIKVTTLRLTKEDDDELAKQEKLLEKIEILHEVNPMLGLRGCRLGLLYPEIYEMQTRAIIEASVELTKEGFQVKPEIMIPLISHINELIPIYNSIKSIAMEIQSRENIKIEYKIGTMVELPRTVLIADKIAEYAEFFSFGTNDLTQTVFGISRDDSEGKFLLKYVEEGILPDNPFEVIDIEGVGKLVNIGVELGRKTNPQLEIGICGEHGGEPKSIDFGTVYC